MILVKSLSLSGKVECECDTWELCVECDVWELYMCNVCLRVQSYSIVYALDSMHRFIMGNLVLYLVYNSLYYAFSYLF